MKNTASLPQSARRFVVPRRIQVGALGALVLVFTSFIVHLPAWRLIDERAFDYLSTFAASPLPEDGPIIVAIDEPSLAEINVQWPWPRSLHGRLISALRAAGAKVIGLDIIFSEPSLPVEDEAFADELGPDVVLAGDETLITSQQADQLVRVMPMPMFSDKRALSGIASVSLARDGVLRTLPTYDQGFAAMVAMAAGVDADPPAPGNRIQSFGGPRTYPTVSYYQALDPEHLLPPGVFSGRPVIVGLSLQNAPTVESRGADAFATSSTVHTGTLTSGAEAQATIFDNLRLNLSIVEAGPLFRQLLLVLAVAIAVLIIWPGTGWYAVIATTLMIAVSIVASYLALRFGRVFSSPIAPSLAFVSIGAVQAAFDYSAERRSRREVTRAFSQYLAPALVEQLARDPSRLKLGGERRELSLLFCDVRGFTTIAEHLKDDPEQLTTLINRLLTPLSDIVLAHGGTIDKYIGDCLMAFWNAPLDDPDHALHAVLAAQAMLAAMNSINDELRVEAEHAGKPHYPLQIGIGINTGDCIVGNMGSTQRFDYSALGDAVNLAARLEGASKAFGVSILIGETTARAIQHDIQTHELGRLTVKGKREEVEVFTLPGLAMSNIDRPDSLSS